MVIDRQASNRPVTIQGETCHRAESLRLSELRAGQAGIVGLGGGLVRERR